MNHPEIIKLVISYTLLGVLVFTAVITCLSLIGLVKFADSKQQQKLFYALIIEIIGGSIAVFFNFLSINPQSVANRIGDKAVQNADLSLAKEVTKEAISSKIGNSVSEGMITVTGRVTADNANLIRLMLDGYDVSVDQVSNTFRMKVNARSVHFLNYFISGSRGTKYLIEITSPESAIWSFEGMIDESGRALGSHSFKTSGEIVL
ncbi:hypothetical protein [Rufibacter psychrotolerans]|uniref:hypothetical protein n=1 Tax=Rufibacter psychrotolerans TaxID=2812556 RepID=UPI001967DA8B|nr:hypothetical protein [Rufibacter sp. SYSU D00308]